MPEVVCNIASDTAKSYQTLCVLCGLLRQMLRWLVQSVEGQPEIAAGQPPPGLLSPVEETRLARFKVTKRRRDWLLGRWTAKQLLQVHVHELSGVAPPLDELIVANGEDGAPRVALTKASADYLPLSLSISHSHGYAFCALYAPQEVAAWQGGPLPQVGADLERVEPRDPNFVTDFFCAGEIDRQRDAPPELHDMLVTAVWSAKEAALKALHLGLRADTRCVECVISPEYPVGWTPFPVRLAGELAAHYPTTHIDGWWRMLETASADFVLTLAILIEGEHRAY